jgi:hypothetical protein
LIFVQNTKSAFTTQKAEIEQRNKEERIDFNELSTFFIVKFSIYIFDRFYLSAKAISLQRCFISMLNRFSPFRWIAGLQSRVTGLTKVLNCKCNQNILQQQKKAFL